MLQPNFTPFPLLFTERLILRELEPQDAETLFFLRSNPQVIQYLGREPAKTMEEIDEFYVRIAKNIADNDGIFWVIAYKNEPRQMLGSICYWQLQKEHFRAEIGYVLHPEHWKKGIMKETIERVLEYGFGEMKLHSVEARLSAGNLASAATLESTGFIKEGHFREDFFFNGEFGDTLVYSKLNPEKINP